MCRLAVEPDVLLPCEAVPGNLEPIENLGPCAATAHALPGDEGLIMFAIVIGSFRLDERGELGGVSDVWRIRTRS